MCAHTHTTGAAQLSCKHSKPTLSEWKVPAFSWAAFSSGAHQHGHLSAHPHCSLTLLTVSRLSTLMRGLLLRCAHACSQASALVGSHSSFVLGPHLSRELPRESWGQSSPLAGTVGLWDRRTLLGAGDPLMSRTQPCPGAPRGTACSARGDKNRSVHDRLPQRLLSHL